LVAPAGELRRRRHRARGHADGREVAGVAAAGQAHVREPGQLVVAVRAVVVRHGEPPVAVERRPLPELVGTGVVARDAGVAKGTIFHRFGDRAGLALALLDEHERALQEQILRGPPPLGPGAPARERLPTFLGAGRRSPPSTATCCSTSCE
jgi:hypothetical protein